MKITMVIFSFLVAVGCNKQSNVPTEQLPARLNEPFQLKVGQSATMSDNFTLTFQSVVDDSRCPKGVECIWAGNASVVIKFSDGTDTLNTMNMKGIVHGAYMMHMESLTPYPEYPNVISKGDYVVTLVATNK
jgi:hypothetical protein